VSYGFHEERISSGVFHDTIAESGKAFSADCFAVLLGIDTQRIPHQRLQITLPLAQDVEAQWFGEK
jgi:hypothetical protein